MKKNKLGKSIAALAILLVSWLAMSCFTPSLPTGPQKMNNGRSGSSGEGSKYQCKVVKGSDNPWLVEWDPTDKVRIESESKRGVLLVKYAGCELEVLYGCEVGGKYEFSSTTRKQQTEYINNEGELFAKLPIGALNLAAEFKQGDRWALDYVLMGTRNSSMRRVNKDQLQGYCAEATHFVSGMAVGAYQLGKKAHRKGSAEVSLGKAGTGGSSGGEAGLLRQDGSFEQCSDAKTLSDDQQCKAIVQLYLQPVSEGSTALSPSLSKGAGISSSAPSTLDSLINNGNESEGPVAPAPSVGTKEYKAKLEKSWAAVKKAARKRNTEDKLELYQAFLGEFPTDNPYAGKARTQIDKWEKKLTEELEKKTADDDAARKRAEAKARQDEIRRAKERAENTTESASSRLGAWKDFVANYPDKDNPYLGTANRKITNLRSQAEQERSNAQLAAQRAEQEKQRQAAAEAERKAEQERKRKAAMGDKEVKQPGTNLYWLRCPVGQTWNGSGCSGSKKTMDWASAKRACLSGYRLPTRQEFVDLLGGCDSDVLRGKVGDCNKCSASSKCSKIFESDIGRHWSSSPNDEDRAWVARFSIGSVDRDRINRSRVVRCVRSGP